MPFFLGHLTQGTGIYRLAMAFGFSKIGVKTVAMDTFFIVSHSHAPWGTQGRRSDHPPRKNG